MSNLPIKEEKGFFKKIKLFFRKLFYKQEQIEHPKVSNELKINEINTSKETFETSIKVQVNDEHVKETQKDEFIKQIEKLIRSSDEYKEYIKNCKTMKNILLIFSKAIGTKKKSSR